MSDFTESYTGQDATLEILIMLGVAFLIGVLFRYAIGRVRLGKLKERIHHLQRSESDLRRINEGLSRKLEYLKGLENEKPSQAPPLRKVAWTEEEMVRDEAERSTG
jgi:hypothetical protein